MRAGGAPFIKLQVLHKFDRNRSDLSVHGQVGEVDKVKILVDRRRFVDCCDLLGVVNVIELNKEAEQI